METDKVKGFDFRVFNKTFVLNMTERTYTNVLRVLERLKVAEKVNDDLGIGSRLKPSDDFRSVTFGGQYTLFMSEAGVRRFEMTLKTWKEDTYLQFLLGKVQEGINFYERGLEGDDYYDDDDDDPPPQGYMRK